MPGVTEKKLLEDDPIISDADDSDGGDDDAEESDDDDSVQEPVTEEQLAIQRMLDDIQMNFNTLSKDMKMELDTLLKEMKMVVDSLSNKLEMKLGDIERMQGHSMMMGQQTLVLLKAIAQRMGIDVAEVLSQVPVCPTPFHGPCPTPVPTTGGTVAAQPDPNSSSPSSAPVDARTAFASRIAFASRDGATAAYTSYPAVVYPAPSLAHAIAAAAIPTSEIPPP